MHLKKWVKVSGSGRRRRRLTHKRKKIQFTENQNKDTLNVKLYQRRKNNLDTSFKNAKST